MFSSGNRSKENNQSYPTQWALNPSAYQNVSNENVDWAALAQQWIMMKESVPPEHPPTGAGNRKEILNEGGEAPMDVEKEDAEEQWPNSETSNTTVHESWNWQQWGAWPGNWNGPPPAAGVVPQPATASPINKTALLPTPYTHFAPNTSDSNSAHSTDYQSYDGAGSSGGNDFGGSSSGYWTNSGTAGRGKHSIKPNRTHRKGFSSDIRPEQSSEPVTLDAAKRRQLPAWIREGLEKMEREKQKQMDRERERVQREEILIRKKEEKEEALELLRSADGSILPPKSKFDSDSGDSGDETRNGNSSRSRAASTKSRRRSSSPSLALTEEERMGMVRRAMTEVLLQVTSSEIDTICQEEVNRFRARTTAKKGGRPAAPSAGPFAAGTLGLGMYGGGSSDSESESEAPGPSQAVLGDDHVDNERRNSSAVNNAVSDDRQQQQQNKENVRRRQSDSQSSRRSHNADARDAVSSDSTADDGKEAGEQVDTTRSHGNGSSRLRGERRRRSSSSNTNSSTTSSRTSSSETSKSKRKKKKSSAPKKKHGRSPRRNHRSSSSQSDDDSSSGSKTSDSRTTSSRRNPPTRRNRSRSVDSDKRRAAPSCSSSKRRRTECSRSVSSGSDSHRRRTESSTSSRNYNDRSRRERSSSRSRHSTRSRRSRSRDRRDRRRSRSRSRSRDRRDSYRSRRRSRSRTRSRSGGGKRTRGH